MNHDSTVISVECQHSHQTQQVCGDEVWWKCDTCHATVVDHTTTGGRPRGRENMTTTKLNRRAWNTYAITGYTHQVGTDALATGGVHKHEVRRVKSGWQKRTSDSTGNFCSPGPITPIDDAEGEALFARAESGSTGGNG